MPTHAPEPRPAGADLKIVNARLVTPTGVRDGAVAVRDGVIVAIGDAADLPEARETIDAKGRYVLPGVVDPEAHPGHSHPLRDVIPSESRAAVASGVTTWGIQNPAPRFGQEPWKQESEPDDVVSFFDVFEKGLGIWSELAHTDFFFTFQIETDQQAEEIPRYARELGVPSVKFYCHTQRMANDSFWFANGTGLARGFDDGTLYLACERAAEVGGMVHIHPENWEVARVLEKRLLAAGRDDMGAWDDRSPWFAEAHHVRQFSYFALITGATMYVQHTTNPLTLREIRRAREEGVRLYSQTGAPWLYFTRDDWRINTPLRSREAVEALWEALADGTVDLVGSDHVVARGRREEMAAEGVWSRKKSGFPSRVEMLLPVMLSEGVNKGRIGIERLVEVCASTPAKIFGLWPRKGAIAVGSDADFVVVDMDREVEVRDEMVHTLPGWTLLHGHRLTGWPVMTILRGRVVAEWRDGEPRAEIVGEPDGRHLAPGTDNIVHTRPLGPRPHGSQPAI